MGEQDNYLSGGTEEEKTKLDALVKKLTTENQILKRKCKDMLTSSERLKCHLSTVKVIIKDHSLLMEVERFDTIYMAVGIQLMNSKKFSYDTFNATIKELEIKLPNILDCKNLNDVFKNINQALNRAVIGYVQDQNKMKCKKIKYNIAENKKVAQQQTIIQLFIKDTANGYNFYTILKLKECNEENLQALPQSSIL